MTKHQKRAEARDATILKLWHRLLRQLPSGTRRVELDIETVDGRRVKLEQGK